MLEDVLRVGARGDVVIPAAVRKRFGLKKGAVLKLTVKDDSIQLCPAEVVEVEVYTPERKAEFLLGSATSKKHYEEACEEVRRMGLDPAKIPHFKPKRWK